MSKASSHPKARTVTSAMSKICRIISFLPSSIYHSSVVLCRSFTRISCKYLLRPGLVCWWKGSVECITRASHGSCNAPHGPDRGHHIGYYRRYTTLAVESHRVCSDHLGCVSTTLKVVISASRYSPVVISKKIRRLREPTIGAIGAAILCGFV